MGNNERESGDPKEELLSGGAGMRSFQPLRPGDRVRAVKDINKWTKSGGITPHIRKGEEATVIEIIQVEDPVARELCGLYVHLRAKDFGIATVRPHLIEKIPDPRRAK